MGTGAAACLRTHVHRIAPSVTVTAHAPAFAVIDVCQLCHSPIRSDVFTSFIDEASGLQSAFTVYYGFDPDLFRAAMIVYAVNVAGRLVLGLLAVVNVDWAEVQLVDGRAWRRVPGLLLMLIEPVSGNKLLESTLEARPVRDLSVTVLRCQIYVGQAGLRPQCRDEIWVWGLAESEGLSRRDLGLGAYRVRGPAS